MPEPITVDKKSEFFIGVAKQGRHSFVLLGVMVDNSPIFLARVGKQNLIDPESYSQFKLFGKALFSHTKAAIAEESLGADGKRSPYSFSYQAYSITYEHYLQFLAIIKEIQSVQQLRYQDAIEEFRKTFTGGKLTAPEVGLHTVMVGVHCYVPVSETADTVELRFQNVTAAKVDAPLSSKPGRKELIEGATVLHASNTCRTTARSLLNYVLGYAAKIPALFYVELSYTAIMERGRTKNNNFYILPPPPNSFGADSLKLKTLNTLFKRLERIPKSSPNDLPTINKFTQLKKLYLELAGNPKLSLADLLDKITLYKANELFKIHRGKGVVSQFLKAIDAKTSTQQAFDEIEETIRKVMEKGGKEQAAKDPSASSGDLSP